MLWRARPISPPMRTSNGKLRSLAPSWPAAALALGGVLIWAPGVCAQSPEVLAPAEGGTLVRELAPGESHAYLVELAADRFLHLAVDQRGVDLEAVLFDPDGERLVASDRPIAYQGPEDLLAVTERPGTYRLEVRALSKARPAGRYEIRIEALRPATDRDRSRAEAAALMTRGNRLRASREAAPAIDAFDQALGASQEAEDPFGQGEASIRIGQTLDVLLGEWRSAAERYLRAAEHFRRAGAARWQALALASRGRALGRMSATDDALAAYGEAAALFRQVRDRRNEGLAQVGRGLLHRARGEPQEALDAYRRAAELFDESMDAEYRADVLHNLGVLYGWLGRWDQAGDSLQAALRAFAELGDTARQATSLNQLGQLRQDQGDLTAAFEAYRETLDLRRRTGDERGEAVTLGKLGRLLQELDQPEEAADHYRRALEILDRLDRPRDTARVRLYRGSLSVRLRRPEEALGAYARALEVMRELGEREGEAEALLGMARAERLRGDFESARSLSESGLAILEAVRPRPVQEDLRISFFATVQHHYDFFVDLLMEMHRADPGTGYDGAAFEASERARARSLIDLLAEAGTEVRRGVDPELLDRERRIRAHLAYQESRRMSLARRSGPDSTRVAELEEQVRALVEELESVRGEIRRRSPAYADLTRPRPASLREIRAGVLEQDELLVEYKLAAERSFLWAVSRDGVASFELPGRLALEALVRSARDALPASRRPDARIRVRRDLCALAREILAPVADKLAGRRLVIVPDGALAYLPFAALPLPGHEPCTEAPPLVAEHEISLASSASVLATQRRGRSDRRPPEGLLAVVSDPVFNPGDERAGPRPDTPALTRSAAGDAPLFRRLVHSRREAEAILRLVPPDRSFRAAGFDATKETVTGGRLADYRLVHFATHGLTDERHAGLSRLVLSLVDPTGARRDGFLFAHEIYDLDLPADLVVLSACQTALGKEVRGEGLMGLTRAFLYAGAKSVMVSLWNVGDLSTAVLMERFYRRLLEDRLSPAEALRRAQVSMWRDEAWAAPYHWAGFVLQGDPR